MNGTFSDTTMDKTFYKYYKYFLWNDGLINHFFSNERQEILLYADEILLEDIGKKAGIEADNYTKDFLTCVEDFCSRYNRYICPDAHNEDNCTRVSCKYYPCLNRNQRRDVLAIAHHMANKGMKYYFKEEDETGRLTILLGNDGKPRIHKLPFFAIVIYIIIKFDMGDSQEWKNVGKIATTSRKYIIPLWKEIHNFNNRFDKDASIYERQNRQYNDYVGRILYHLPLSISTRNKIQDAIYKSSVWKLADSLSFTEVLGFITGSLKDESANNELADLLKRCFSADDSKGILARKVQDVIDNFDIDAYEAQMAERMRSRDFNNTIISGRFALGIYLPNNPDANENSIVLLTTVQQHVSDQNFLIQEGGSGTLAGYNTSFVKYNGTTAVKLENYSLIKKGRYHISPLPCNDVVFFYEYDPSLYIQYVQTNDNIPPANSYIIAVRSEKKETFIQWCNNNNTAERWPLEVTEELFGNNWTIFYIGGRANGAYDGQTAKENATGENESRSIIMKGGIKNSRGIYFINALPYFEVPACYTADRVKVHMNLNGIALDQIKKIVWKQKIMLDPFPIKRDLVNYIDIRLEYDGDTCFNYSISVCDQSINYEADKFYRYNNFGIICQNDEDPYYQGNFVKTNSPAEIPPRGFELNIKSFDSISDGLYLTNLLAACCYDSPTSEITHDKFRSCVNYAATRQNIDFQREGFISKVKRIFAQAGILNINYVDNKCQALPPTFMKIPFSIYHNPRARLIMLSGCYSISFISDLVEYCKSNTIGIYMVSNDVKSQDEEKLLPPIVVLDCNFNVADFRDKKKQECEEAYFDLAFSLLTIIPETQKIESKFNHFSEFSEQFRDSLNDPTTKLLPRLRSRGESFRRTWYIERQNNQLAEIPTGLASWATIYCHLKADLPMVVKYTGNSVFLPTSMFLPSYAQRALFLMNMGLPTTHKVFICNNKNENYYVLMHKYNLYSEERCSILASKLTGGNKNLIRDNIRSDNEPTMEYWTSKFNGSKYQDRYLVLYENGDTMAIAHQRNVYVKSNDCFCRINSPRMNEVLTFLIKEKWVLSRSHSSIGYSKNGGVDFEQYYTMTNEQIELPNKKNFNIEEIIIA